MEWGWIGLFICPIMYMFMAQGLPEMGAMSVWEYLLELGNRFIEYASYSDIWIIVLINLVIDFFIW